MYYIYICTYVHTSTTSMLDDTHKKIGFLCHTI